MKTPLFRLFAGALSLAALAAGLGCGQAQSSNDREQVQAAIVDRLTQRGDLDMNKMEVVVDSLDVQGDKAVADTSFRMPGSDQAAMKMRYNLERSGGKWKVVEAGSSGHGGMGGGQSGAPAMPPGHPTTPAQPPQPMPEGHPPVSQ